MELEKFSELARQKTKVLKSPANYFTSRFFHLRVLLAEMLSDLDFGCDFDSDGRCIEKRDSKSERYNCCCTDCARDLGYFTNIPESWIPGLAPKFDEKTGFLGKNGCKLDHKYRSSTCLKFACSYLRDKGKISQHHKDLMALVEVTGI